MTGPADTRTPWQDDIDTAALAVAHMGFERAQVAQEREPWRAAVDRLVSAGAILTRPDADRLAERHRRHDRADANTAHDQLRHQREQFERRSADTERALARVRGLVNHRRKTLRMADLVAALEGWPS